MTAGNAGKGKAGIITALLAGISLLTSCAGNLGPLKPAWQQDPNLYHHGVPARPAQTATTPHLIMRVIYADSAHLQRLIERQGDVPDTQRGLARMGDGTFDLGFQDVATGKWIESHLCGGILFVSGLPNQAYRIVLKNRTPMPLELGVGVDGKDLTTGAAASHRRGGVRVNAHATCTLEQSSQGPLLFKEVDGDGVLFDVGQRGRTGLIQIAVFLAPDAPSVGPEKLRPGQIAPLGILPMGVPEQYR